MGVHCDLILGSIANQTFVIGKRDIGRGGTVSLVVGDDLHTIILPDTDATEEKIRKSIGEIDSKGSSRVSGAEINTDSF